MADQKTESPTKRRLEKAQRDGQFPVSQHLLGALQFALALWLLVWAARTYLPSVLSGFQSSLRWALTSADLALVAGELQSRVAILPALALGLTGLYAAAFAVHLLTTQGRFAAARLAPSMERLSPIARLRQLSSQGPLSLLQAACLAPAFAWAFWATLREHGPQLVASAALPLTQGVLAWWEAAYALLFRGLMVLVAWGAFDYGWQQFRFRQNLRMTKQEVRDEHRETDGNPEVKGRIRRLQRSLAQRRMMAEVPTATAVIVNPTHYAVAIRYDASSMATPTVVAKGKNYLALRIRQRAEENQVPVVENPPLARALYKAVVVGQEIPPDFYRAVAEILAYIYRIMQGQRAR